MQIVRPALGEIFERVAGGVGIHITARPVGRRAIPVVGVQALLVGLSLVAEQSTELAGRLGNQTLPIVVARFVAEVAEQRTVVLAHGHAHAFAQMRIGLQQVDGDAAVAVAGHHGIVKDIFKILAVDARIRQNAERQAIFALCAAFHRQPQLVEREQQPPFRLFHRIVESRAVAIAEIGDDLVEGTGSAVGLRRIQHQPVAGAVCRVVGAEPVGGRNRTQAELRRIEGERPTTAQAAVVLEVDLVAAIATERAHERQPC